MTTATLDRTASGHDVAELDHRLNRAILDGRALEAFDELYADEVSMRENGEDPIRGKEANRKREEEFFGSISELHELSLVSSAVGNDVSLSEWVFDVTFEDGNRKRLEQTAVRRWKDGEVVEERFYYDPN